MHFFQRLKIMRLISAGSEIYVPGREKRRRREVGVFAIRKVFSLFSQNAGRLLALLVITFALYGCHYRDGISATLTQEGEVVLKRLAILPFEEKFSENDTAVSCPLCGAVFHTDKNSTSGAAFLENTLLESLEKDKRFTIVTPDRSGEIYRRLSASSKEPLRDVLKRLGSEVEADGVLIGYLFRYRERKGYTYSVEKPASVAFDVHLMRVKDGAILWRCSFDRTQSSLMENLFQISSFYRHGIKWITVRELADEGMEEVVKTFPGTN